VALSAIPASQGRLIVDDRYLPSDGSSLRPELRRRANKGIMPAREFSMRNDEQSQLRFMPKLVDHWKTPKIKTLGISAR
jgi:hypothetical protein